MDFDGDNIEFNIFYFSRNRMMLLKLGLWAVMLYSFGHIDVDVSV